MRAPEMLRWLAAATALVVLLAAAPAAGFYLPGVVPTDFSKGDSLPVKVNKLTSVKTQLPYAYYSLPFCKPETIVDSAENLGEVLRGDRIENSPYVFQMREPKMCQVVCKLPVGEKEAKELKEKIEDEYRVNMILDNLPLVVPVIKQDKNIAYQGGYHIGVKGQYTGSKEEKYFIHNHLSFLVKYHKDDDSELSRIVGFEVNPYSIKHQLDDKWDGVNTRLSTCDPHANKLVTSSDSPQEVEAGKEIIFTYDVRFEESDIKWASRWDTYLLMTDDQIHWFSIVNSLMIVLFLSVLGFLSPSNRGGLMTAMLLVWVLMGLLAGYASSRLYKMFKGSEWKKITMRTAFFFPGIAFVIFFILNALIWGEKSSGAVPFTTMFALVLLWFGISVPLVFVGSYLGFKKPALEPPVKTNKIPRQIPEQAWYMNPIFTILIGGILPFGAVFIELFFILTSIWLHQFYYIFGFLFLVFVILIITCAEITIVLCYFQLCSEDYMWWWRSYLTSGSSALYLFLYAAFYFFTKLQITKLVSGILYFGYMLLASLAFFVLTGTIGFCACFWFTRLIYSSVKID
ncbi:hypothetical protein E2562_008818 [Oryza meyeriana var. granulata]|uniref:Transmembrane 9 superfamily member n=1 Tax=Oryza meyeriana var. granulata TaxID=110450 RepID=A0A6G1D040_9ORYZ|nr:hypothetical protein E2562_008818 [Oryza meyeriana var. granulata]